MKLGILKADSVQAELVTRFGEYPDMFIALLERADPALEFTVYDVEKGFYPRDIDEMDAYLLTGSKASAYDDEPWIKKLVQFLQELHRRRKKLVGVCFGHQLVAEALGGSTRKSSRGWGVGVQTYQFAQTPALHDQGEADIDLLVSHQDQVEVPAEGAVVLAGNEFCENAVCAIGEHILTFQGHPEFQPEYLQVLMASRRENIGEATYQAALASLVKMPQSERAGRWIINFLKG